MDKVVLSNEDVAFLDEFMKNFIQEYPETKLPIPLKAFEVNLENEITVRYARDSDKFVVYVRFHGEKKFRATGVVLNGRLIEITDVQDNDLPEDMLHRFLEALVALYGDIVMFMVYGGFAFQSDEEAEIPVNRTKTHKKSVEKKKKQSPSTVYILHRDRKGACIVPQGSHASPSYAFTVRGHLRHYKNGNTIWIAQYEKGGKQHKGKTYKVRRETPKGE